MLKKYGFVFTEFGTSGREDKIRESIAKYVKGKVDKIDVDVNGSLICLKKGNGKNKKKLMFAAHMDAIGFIITHIDKNGFLRFSAVGYQPSYRIVSKQVIFENQVRGVIGIEKDEDFKSIAEKKLFIDIGANSKEEAEKMVEIGMTAIMVNNPFEQNNKLFSSYLDDRIGCAILLELIDNIKEPYHDVYYVFTSQEEVGVRGAKTSSYSVEPDLGIALDVTVASDTPEVEFASSTSFGKGAAIKVMDRGIIVPKKLVDFLVQLCEKNKIPYQKEILTMGATDAMAIQQTKGGIIAGTISIPTRYVHSANEVCDLGDVESSVKLCGKIAETEFPF